jgi:hypothetical protein
MAAMRLRVPFSAIVYMTLLVSMLMLGIGVFIMADPYNWFATIGSGGLVGGLLEALRQMRDEKTDSTTNTTTND